MSVEKIKSRRKFKIKKLNINVKNTVKTQAKPFLKAFLLVGLVAVLGNIFTNTKSAWFNSLFLPEFYPPAATFPIVWSIVYLFMAVGLYLIIRSGCCDAECKKLYIINGVLNVLWTIAFFSVNSLVLSVIIFVMLLVFAVLLSKKLYCTNKLAFYLSLPYVIWLAFAFMLNYAIFLLN